MTIEAALKFIAEGIAEGSAAALLKAPVAAAFDAIFLWRSGDKKRSEALKGAWSGTVNQTDGTKAEKYRFVFRLQRPKGSKHLEGRGLLWPASQRNDPKIRDIDELRLVARCQGSFLVIDFRNAKDSKEQFGTIMAKVSGDSETMTGRFAAISLADSTPVGGSLDVKKQSSILDVKLN